MVMIPAGLGTKNDCADEDQTIPDINYDFSDQRLGSTTLFSNREYYKNLPRGEPSFLPIVISEASVSSILVLENKCSVCSFGL
jgi:hypothetical protein